MSKTNDMENSSVNIIGAGTSVVGDIKSNGDFRIDGSVNGTIQVKGKLIVGSTGKIEGEINCQTSEIAGDVKGKINVSDLLSLRSTAKVNGDIVTGKISIEPDAQFTGSCSMGNAVKKMEPVNEAKPQAQSKPA
jgi:cytoskeletal protein CcmA (bactofilin family)